MKRFEVAIKPSALREIEAVDSAARERIKTQLRLLADDPLPHGAEKLSGRESMYRVRKGNFRIVYAIDFEGGIVRVLAVAHRKDVYRNLQN